jgi:hypothetical protein
MAAFCLYRWKEALDRFAHAARKEFDGYGTYHDRY